MSAGSRPDMIAKSKHQIDLVNGILFLSFGKIEVDDLILFLFGLVSILY